MHLRHSFPKPRMINSKNPSRYIQKLQRQFHPFKPHASSTSHGNNQHFVINDNVIDRLLSLDKTIACTYTAHRDTVQFIKLDGSEKKTVASKLSWLRKSWPLRHTVNLQTRADLVFCCRFGQEEVSVGVGDGRRIPPGALVRTSLLLEFTIFSGLQD